VKMLYVPDARGYTIEIIEGSGRQRMVQNLRRWSGNMLRNGQRAIMLGPTRMPLFIWWCCVDQRLAVWTMLFSPVLAVAATAKIGWAFLLAYIAYLAVTRGLLSLVLFFYSRRVDMNYIWALYANQLVNALVKAILMWRLAKQRWANRGNQKQGIGAAGRAAFAREMMAHYLTAFSFATLFLAVMIYSELLIVPDFSALRMMLGF